MGTTPLYELESIDYAVTGWNGIVTANMQKIEQHLHSRLLVTLGETVAVGDVVHIAADGLAYKAQALVDGSKQPAVGFAVDPGDAGEEIRIQRVGLFAMSGLEAGRVYFLSQVDAGKIIPSGMVEVADEPFTATVEAYVSLAHSAIVPMSETVTTADGGTTYVRGTDYDMDYSRGEILAKNTGGMGNNDYLIGYDYNPTSIRPQLMGYATTANQLFISCGLSDYGLVHIEGDEEIAGIKTFKTLPRMHAYRAPLSNEDFALKKYVDDKVASGEQGDATTIAGVLVDPTNIGDDRVLRYNAETGNLEYESLPSGADAGSILGVTVNDAAKADGKILKYDAATQTLKYMADEGGSGSGLTAAEAKKLAIIFG